MADPAAPGRSTAVVYLARGADEDCLDRFRRFLRSYLAFRAGLPHDLWIVFKGFADEELLASAQSLFAEVAHTVLTVEDDTFDIGAYADAAREIRHDRVCFLNSNSELAGQDWLLKLSNNLDQPRVGLVGASGSLESLSSTNRRFPAFPNMHLRSNAFLMRTADARDILGGFHIRNKMDAFLTESGPNSITRQIVASGRSVLVVGRNGRGYSPLWWPESMTFRQDRQQNLLVHDNQTRMFDRMTWTEKRHMSGLSWGSSISTGSAGALLR